MSGRDLLPPLYGIVFEYLTLSEQWYVAAAGHGAVAQFKTQTAKAPKADLGLVMRDAIETDHFPAFLALHDTSGGHPYLPVDVVALIIKHDRSKMLEHNKYHLDAIRLMITPIMANGAIQILRHAHGAGMRGFSGYTHCAARGGHLQCLQELARLEPEYKGEDDIRVYQEAVASDNVEMVQFIETTWPEALKLRPHHDSRDVKTLACAEAKSAKMARHLLGGIPEHDRTGRASSLLYAAIAIDSVEMFEVVVGLMRASPAGAIHKHLRSDGRS